MSYSCKAFAEPCYLLKWANYFYQLSCKIIKIYVKKEKEREREEVLNLKRESGDEFKIVWKFYKFLKYC